MMSAFGKIVRFCVLFAITGNGFFLKNAEATGIQESFSNIYREKANVVVRVKASTEDKDAAQIGSGFFISEKGHLLTTASAIKGAEKFTIEHGKKIYEATLIGSDETTNVALLKTEELPEGANYVVLSETRTLPEVTTFIASLSYKLDFGITPALGYIEGSDVSYFEHLWPTTLLRASIKMDGGDGGGSVFDVQGNLIGMLAYSLKDIQQGSYIVPVRVLAKVCNDLLLFGSVRYGYVGIESEAVWDKLKNQICQRVVSIQPNSPAAKAGIRENDILLSFDEKSIQSREELINFSFFTYPGQKIVVTLLRDAKEFKLTLEIGARSS